ncbi:DEAD/DEAH box helicase [bacterium]|nr:DEAD/DEAH box helicase [bacterium]
MQISKITSVNFNGRSLRSSKNLSNIIKHPENIKLASSLTALASLGVASSAIDKKENEVVSFEKTLEENYFKLPENAKPHVFQKVSAAYLYGGNDVLVTAPTATGKTAIANYIITKNLKEGKKTFYTAPIKALSNEKYNNFKKMYGDENVGILTGDVQENENAPIVLMTTEVYKNLVDAEKNLGIRDRKLENLKTVIFDEVHNLGDDDRGDVWEQSIIYSNPNTQILSLSATIGNNDDLAEWMSNIRGLNLGAFRYNALSKTKAKNNSVNELSSSFMREITKTKNFVKLVDVPTEYRAVPLEYHNILVSGEKIQASKVKNKDRNNRALKSKSQSPIGDDYKNMVSMLKAEDKLPAIFYIFSKRGCRKTLDHLAHYGEILNSEKEVNEIREIIERYKKEGKYLGETLNLKAIEKGYSVHNAGLLPNQKELIEELFNKKLIKVLFATETLAMGINMPTRSVVLSSHIKPTSEGMRPLTPNEINQMSGRAGRQGKDDKGYCYTMSMDKEQKAIFENLIESGSNDVKSVFNDFDYSFVAGYYDSHDESETIKEIGKKSFFAYDKEDGYSEDKLKEFVKNFNKRRKILRKFDFMDSEVGLTTKGKLLTKLNGYEQIPVINAVEARRLGGFNGVELAGAVGALANIKLVQDLNKNIENRDSSKVFRHKNTYLDYFVSTEDNKLKKYNQDMAKIDSNYKDVEFNQDAIYHVYNWAEYNSKNDNSEENWKNLVEVSNLESSVDEGTLFEEITGTINLLKQIIKISKEGVDLSENDYDKKYYKDLINTARESIELLSKTPIINNMSIKYDNK